VSDEGTADAAPVASVKEESKAVVTLVERPAAPAAVPIETNNRKMYHIVVGSFPTEKQANDFLSGVDKSTYKNSDKVFRNDKYRVYVNRFDNRDEAEKYLENVRSNPKYKDAWLFISK
jgi:cell division protein FtsN